MAVTRRGKTLIAIVAILVLGAGAFAVLALTGNAPEIVKKALPGDQGEETPPACPLTGLPAPGEEIPDRPALAIKVENAPEARPQYGLDTADIIYEEPVEGGVTRFIVIYQCADAKRVEPVRSARTSDPAILLQYGQPAFGYADAAGYVQKAVQRNKAILDLNWKKLPEAYHEDSSREAPHHLYTSTKELWRVAQRRNLPVPEPVFEYSEEFPDAKSRKVRQVHLYFSDFSDVYWKWKGEMWMRSHDGAAHELAGAGPVQADNVLIQIVKLKNTGRKDVVGTIVPEVQSIGSGKAYLLRDGRMIIGKWERKSEADITAFVTRTGDTFLLKPGNTWIELYPADRPKVEV